jgi:hypothetical protein
MRVNVGLWDRFLRDKQNNKREIVVLFTLIRILQSVLSKVSACYQPLKHTLPLVQWTIAVVYLVNAMFAKAWAVLWSWGDETITMIVRRRYRIDMGKLYWDGAQAQ